MITFLLGLIPTALIVILIIVLLFRGKKIKKADEHYFTSYFPYPKDDEELLIRKQTMEDASIYTHYERQRLDFERNKVIFEREKTLAFIAEDEYADLHYDSSERITAKYKRYLIFCQKAGLQPLLEEEFLIKENNIVYCGYLKMFLLAPRTGNAGIYNIHHEETAKYANGYSPEAEFEDNWFKE